MAKFTDPQATLKRKYAEAFDYKQIADMSNLAATRWEGEELADFLAELGRSAAVIQEASQDNAQTKAAYTLRGMFL
jgi:hypothetical protein